MSQKDYRDLDLLRQMETEMARIADEALRGFFDVPAPNKFWQPRADVHETGDAIIVKMELAGVSRDRLSVELASDGRTLTVAGVRGEQDDERTDRIRCYQLEIYFGPFEREIVLPGSVRVDPDAIDARMADGFLVITLPKRVGQPADSRVIPIAEG